MATDPIYDHMHLVVNGVSILTLLGESLSLGEEVLTETDRLYRTNPMFQKALKNAVRDNFLPSGHLVTSLSISSPKEIHVWFITIDAFKEMLETSRLMSVSGAKIEDMIAYVEMTVSYPPSIMPTSPNTM